MGWICGKHLGVVLADLDTCGSCNPPLDAMVEGKRVTLRPGTVGRGYTKAEVDEQVADALAKAALL